MKTVFHGCVWIDYEIRFIYLIKSKSKHAQVRVRNTLTVLYLWNRSPTVHLTEFSVELQFCS